MITDRIGLHSVLLPLLIAEIPNKSVFEPSADYFKSPCLLELRKNAIEVDLRVPGNYIEFRFNSVPVRKPKNILQLENLLSQW